MRAGSTIFRIIAPILVAAAIVGYDIFQFGNWPLFFKAHVLGYQVAGTAALIGIDGLISTPTRAGQIVPILFVLGAAMAATLLVTTPDFEDRSSIMAAGSAMFAAFIIARHFPRVLAPTLFVAGAVSPLLFYFKIDDTWGQSWRNLLGTLACLAVIDTWVLGQPSIHTTQSAAPVEGPRILDYWQADSSRAGFVSAMIFCLLSVISMIASLYAPMHLGSYESPMGTGAVIFSPWLYDGEWDNRAIIPSLALFAWLDLAIWVYQVALGKRIVTPCGRIVHRILSWVVLAVAILGIFPFGVTSDYGLIPPNWLWLGAAVMMCLAVIFVTLEIPREVVAVAEAEAAA
jgi:hypothetical protein